MSKPLSSRAEKVLWLVVHVLDWSDWPNPTTERRVILMMQQDGLISKKTHAKNVLDLGPLIADARQKIRERKNRRSELWPR